MENGENKSKEWKGDGMGDEETEVKKREIKGRDL